MLSWVACFAAPLACATAPFSCGAAAWAAGGRGIDAADPLLVDAPVDSLTPGDLCSFVSMTSPFNRLST
jgi:hypothetical protein